MFKKFVVCLSLLNIAAYASEDGFANKNEAFGGVSDQRGQNAKTIELDQVNLKQLADDFWDCTFDEDRFDDMKRIFFSIPEKWRSAVIKSRDLLLGVTPFVTVSIVGNFKGVKFLVEHDADIYAVDKFGYDAFSWAKMAGRTDVMDYLRSKDVRGWYKNPLDIVQRFIENKSTPDNSDNIELAPFHLGVLTDALCDVVGDNDRFEDMERAFSLMSYIPEKQRSRVINYPGFLGMSSLMTAAFNGNLECAKFLVEHGADVYAEDKYGQDAYYWAERGGNEDVVEYLRSQMMGKDLSAEWAHGSAHDMRSMFDGMTSMLERRFVKKQINKYDRLGAFFQAEQEE